MVLPEDKENQAPLGPLSTDGFGRAVKSATMASNLHLKIPAKELDASWLVQTGLALTEGSRESKGQSWLIKRASSTSLHTPADDQSSERPSRSPYGSGRNTPNHSRRGSRERRRSRRELVMTPAAVTPSTVYLQEPGFPQSGTDDPTKSTFITTGAHSQEYEEGVMKADWVDSQTQAEIAAELEGELAAELDDAELYSNGEEEYWRENRYDMLDFEAQRDSDDEREVQKAVKERGFRLGRWVDHVVDAFLKLGEDDEDERDLEVGTEPKKDDAQTEESDEVPTKREKEVSEGSVEEDDIEPAPDNPKTIWEDVAWFGRLVLQTAKS